MANLKDLKASTESVNANSIKGNNTGSTAAAIDLTTTQTTAMLNAMVGDSGSGGTKGLVPAPGAGDAAAGKYLKADGTWAVAGGGTVPVDSLEVFNLGLSVTVAANAMTIALKQADGVTDPTTGTGAVKIAFRSATLGSGVIVERTVTAATSHTIISGSTLGTDSAYPDYIYVYAIDNAGTVQIGVCGSSIIDERVLVGVTGTVAVTDCVTLNGPSTTTNKAVRLIGRIRSQQATAGTWLTLPSEIYIGDKAHLPAGTTIAKSADFKAKHNFIYNVSSAGAARTITLPPMRPGFTFTVKDVGYAAHVNNITIARNGGENIDGAAANKILSTPNGTWTFVTDGASWVTVNSTVDTPNVGIQGSAEIGQSGWLTYLDAAGASPVDGTGGVAFNIALSTTATTPLSGNRSFLITKQAANIQGSGLGYNFNINSSDQAKVMQIAFDYKVDSGTFVAGSAGVDSDITVWIYDVTNAILIQPSTYKLFSNSSTVTSQFIGSFQTASNSTSYRLIFHVGTTSAAAWNLKFDNVSVTPTQYVYGTPITDWIAYTPTYTGFGTVTANESHYRRVGQNLEGRIKFTTGTTTAVEARISLPAGLVSAATDLIPSIRLTGHGVKNAAAAGNLISILGEPSVSYVTIGNGNGANPLTKFLGTSVGSAEAQSYIFSIPIQGWGASTQMSDSADTRVIAGMFFQSSVITATGGSPIIFSSISKDTHSAYNTSTGKYRAPVSGYYKVDCTTNGSATIAAISAYIDNVQASPQYIGYHIASQGTGMGSGIVFVNAGQDIDIRTTTTVTSFTGSFTITRVSGPSAIAATETIAASYWLSADQTTSVQINYDSKDFDTHGAVTTGVGAWKFTAPAAGIYMVTAMCYATTTANYSVYKNGSSHKFIAYGISSSNATSGTCLVKLVAGDTIDIRPGASVAVQGGALNAPDTNTISINRI